MQDYIENEDELEILFEYPKGRPHMKIKKVAVLSDSSSSLLPYVPQPFKAQTSFKLSFDNFLGDDAAKDTAIETFKCKVCSNVVLSPQECSGCE